MNVDELVGKFSAMVAAAAAEKDRQATISIASRSVRHDDADHCKRQLTDNVLPFLTELQSQLPDGQFSFAPQVDLHDHKAVGVSFKIGDGPATTISTAFGNVVVTRSGDSGSPKGVNYVFPSDVEPLSPIRAT